MFATPEVLLFYKPTEELKLISASTRERSTFAYVFDELWKQLIHAAFFQNSGCI